MQPSLPDLLAVAQEAAYLAGRRTLAYFNAGVPVEVKPDQTPVTIADREAEQMIRAHITRHFPDHSILGEEGGESRGNPDYRWIIDPIDGTKTFIRGVPFYGVLIGVEVRGKADVGVIYLPALDEMVSAARGLGCRWNGRPARVSAIDRLADAALCVSDMPMAVARGEGYRRLAAAVKFQRTWGDCYGYVLAATGRIEIMADPAMNPWDCAPLLVVMEEAGGRFTDWKGEPTIWGKDAVASNGKLHASVIEMLSSLPPRSVP